MKELLKKLKSFVNYLNIFSTSFKMPLSIFKNLRGKKKNVDIDNDKNVIFLGNYRLLKKDNPSISLDDYVIEKASIKLNKIFIKKLFIYIAFVLILGVFIFTPRFIREIKFSDEMTYDEQVYDFVYDNLKKTGPFYTLKIELNDLSHQLRLMFPYYAFIGVTLNNSCLYIDIEKIRLPFDNNIQKMAYGDIISKKEAIIYSVSVKTGVTNVHLNQYVKKGEILVSGNLDFQVEPEKRENLCVPNGIIVGTTLAYEEIIIPKVISKEVYTGKLKSKIKLKFGKKFISKIKPEYEHETVQLKEKIKFFNFFSIYQEVHYERRNIIITYNYEDALRLAESKIRSNLENNRVSKLEKILDIELNKGLEQETSFSFIFLVKKRENIGTFCPY